MVYNRPTVIETGTDVDEELRTGVALCRAGDWERGLPLLVRLAEERGQLSPVAKSYLGYGLAYRQRKVREGLKLCRRAVEQEFYQPDVLYNLARTEVLAKNRVAAVQALETGLKIDPDHRGLMELRDQVGIRRPPVIPFLARENVLNVLLGRLRHAVKG